ncbi:hypothetical protein [Bradyrhizobium sp.]|uniref:hypothetical protein n=1 Tax=Bradyrhizobium sp. TaxID=376 RepID=UPI003BAEB1FA
MSADQADDRCPYCRSSFEIVFVKFKISGAAMIASCPNCAIVSAESCPESKILDEAKQLASITRSFWLGVVSRMDSLNLRFRYVLAFLFAAVITAAALRHGVHVYAGISPAEIRSDAIMAIPAVALAIIVFRRKRRAPSQLTSFRRYSGASITAQGRAKPQPPDRLDDG